MTDIPSDPGSGSSRKKPKDSADQAEVGEGTGAAYSPDQEGSEEQFGHQDRPENEFDAERRQAEDELERELEHEAEDRIDDELAQAPKDGLEKESDDDFDLEEDAPQADEPVADAAATRRHQRLERALHGRRRSTGLRDWYWNGVDDTLETLASIAGALRESIPPPRNTGQYKPGSDNQQRGS